MADVTNIGLYALVRLLAQKGIITHDEWHRNLEMAAKAAHLAGNAEVSRQLYGIVSELKDIEDHL